MNRPPSGPPAGHPAWLVATWFGVGTVPVLPGTVASLVALPFAWVIERELGAAGLVVAALIALAAGLWACRYMVAPGTREDPGLIVIDEVAGQWLALAGLALVTGGPDPLFYATGFALFRFFDILKPWPIDWLEGRLRGPVAVMLDDLLAGLFAAIGTVIIFHYSQSNAAVS